MRRVYLQEKYLFREAYIEPYEQGDKFPHLILRYTKKGLKYSVSKKGAVNLMLAPFIEWYIQAVFDPERTLLEGSMEGKSIFERADKEISIKNYFDGVKGVIKPGNEELIGEDYIFSGSLETAKEYVEQIAKAIKCCKEKNVPEDRWPLGPLISLEKDKREYLGRILDGIGKPDLMLISMGSS